MNISNQSVILGLSSPFCRVVLQDGRNDHPQENHEEGDRTENHHPVMGHYVQSQRAQRRTSSGVAKGDQFQRRHGAGDENAQHSVQAQGEALGEKFQAGLKIRSMKCARR